MISIEKTGENFRLIYDVKGRFTVHRITNEEAKVSSPDFVNLGTKSRIRILGVFYLNNYLLYLRDHK